MKEKERKKKVKYKRTFCTSNLKTKRRAKWSFVFEAL